MVFDRAQGLGDLQHHGAPEGARLRLLCAELSPCKYNYNGVSATAGFCCTTAMHRSSVPCLMQVYGLWKTVVGQLLERNARRKTCCCMAGRVLATFDRSLCRSSIGSWQRISCLATRRRCTWYHVIGCKALMSRIRRLCPPGSRVPRSHLFTGTTACRGACGCCWRWSCKLLCSRRHQCAQCVLRCVYEAEDCARCRKTTRTWASR